MNIDKKQEDFNEKRHSSIDKVLEGVTDEELEKEVEEIEKVLIQKKTTTNDGKRTSE